MSPWLWGRGGEPGPRPALRAQPPPAGQRGHPESGRPDSPLAGGAPRRDRGHLHCRGTDRNHCLWDSPDPLDVFKVSAGAVQCRAGTLTGRTLQGSCTAGTQAERAGENAVARPRHTKTQTDGHQTAGTLPARRRRAPLPGTRRSGATSTTRPTAAAARWCNP